MRKFLLKKWSLIATLAVVAVFGLSINAISNSAWAEDAAPAEENNDKRISISISPVTESFSLRSNSTYDGVLKVTNAGSVAFNFEVYSAPYSFALNQSTNDYGPSYTSENNYTQIARWITVRDQAGNYVQSVESGSNSDATHPVFSAAPGETVEVAYRISTPENIPAGGQYATLFARTMPNESEESGINALANLGMKVFGRSEEGEAIQSAEVSDLWVSKTIDKDTQVEENGTMVTKNTSVKHINGHALVRNTGNLDFSARGVLTVTSIFGGDPYYQTPENQAQVSIIPESEMVLKDEWEDTPSFGLYRAVWTVTAGDVEQSSDMIVCLIPPFAIVFVIILLTIIIIWIIIVVRKRKERRSRFTI